MGVSVAAVAGTTMTVPAVQERIAKAPNASRVAVTALAQAPSRPAQGSAIAGAVARWNSLRQSDSLPFSSYASFLSTYRGWPGETAMRRTAERRLSVEPVSPREVLRFFDAFPPLTPTGHAQRAFALLATGERSQALEAARTAWTSGVLAQTDESRLLGAFGSGFTTRDHDRRMDVLLDNGDRQSAGRTLAMSSSERRPLYEARLAMQNRSSDAAPRLAAIGSAAASDPGFLADRAVWLRETGNSAAAREWLAQPRRLRNPPANPEKFMETMVAFARAASNDRQWTTAYRIASQVDDIFPAGTDVSRGTYGERDEYTNLTWLAGQAALRLNRPADAAAMFDRYGRAAQSPQTRAKGFYWAARSAAQAGQTQQSNAWLEQAAASPDQFYGLLALERLGRTPPAPPATPSATAEERAVFARRPLAEATRYLGMTGQRNDQTQFVRALASSLDNDRDRAVAAEFGRSIGRLDMGVWAAREARSNGDSFYTRAAFPEVTIPPAYRNHWAAAHGIMRQESSFERSAVSSANARGMMQLIPSTAQIEARRLGVPFNAGRLTEDPDYNILLGTAHLSRLMDQFGGNLVLVAVAYNAGPGRVPQWIAANGDPRLPGTDVVQWIESIPFSETRNYVQRVVENAMIYDTIHPERSRSHGRVSYYLGQRSAR
ncbi:lytic transglycosylase domain-containing protein [Sphingosinicella sp. LHD-64]|uniref:lytic transglycosylase domain-containing protein n=1 Tax=Sphingosinicella sp. LHD-64 TaxID=3072139 RepID=UPI00280DD290|nr:lytic transglycosylase domain-containing protein [Sphingosinicella sp. LHD-64]MDQ8754858.1 lytic transglycosylase domain-containing protein [Sphingosinicella sp. LHD-64]